MFLDETELRIWYLEREMKRLREEVRRLRGDVDVLKSTQVTTDLGPPEDNLDVEVELTGESLQDWGEG